MQQTKTLGHVIGLKVGDIFFLDDPIRVSQVIEIGGYIDRVTMKDGEKKISREEAVVVQSGIPTQPIDGLLDKIGANEAAAASVALRESTSQDYWSEVWGVRTVGALESPSGRPARRNEDRPVNEVYVHEFRDIRHDKLAGSGLVNKAVSCVKLETMPEGVFSGYAEFKEGAIPEPSEREKALPTNFLALKKMCKDKGIDISDIEGKNATKRIRERILRNE